MTLNRGVPIQSAVACVLTRKDPWRSSKTLGILQALSNAYLINQGVVELRDGWIRSQCTEAVPIFIGNDLNRIADWASAKLTA